MLSRYVYITSNESHLVKLLLCYKIMNITRFFPIIQWWLRRQQICNKFFLLGNSLSRCHTFKNISNTYNTLSLNLTIYIKQMCTEMFSFTMENETNRFTFLHVQAINKKKNSKVFTFNAFHKKKVTCNSKEKNNMFGLCLFIRPPLKCKTLSNCLCPSSCL